MTFWLLVSALLALVVVGGFATGFTGVALVMLLVLFIVAATVAGMQARQ